MRDEENTKVVCIVGPTASGKSSLAIEVALRFNGEVISADSRQVYRGLDIGTGKVTQEEMRGVPNHLLDVHDPDQQYTVADFVKDGTVCIEDITARDKLPIVAGGTGFYIEALLYGISLPDVPPDDTLRKYLSGVTTEELLGKLKKPDPHYAEVVDKHNPRRLIRAIEIARSLGKVPIQTKQDLYSLLTIGIDGSDDELKERIATRLHARIEAGMIDEAIGLHKKGLSYERMRELGLEYRFLADLLEEVLTYDEFVVRLERAIWHYAKRQRTWFRRNKNIVWVDIKNPQESYTHIEHFLNE